MIQGIENLKWEKIHRAKQTKVARDRASFIDKDRGRDERHMGKARGETDEGE